MDLTIKEKACTHVGISFEQFCYLLSLRCRINQEDFKKLIDDRYVLLTEGKIALSGKGFNAVSEILRLSTVVDVALDDVKNLAAAMAEVFPKGKKIGTNKYWKGNSALVVKKLTSFLKRYGKFPPETILRATEAYVKSFGDDTSLMRILPYFIEKDGESDLLTFIENLGDIEDEDVVLTEKLL